MGREQRVGGKRHRAHQTAKPRRDSGAEREIREALAHRPMKLNIVLCLRFFMTLLYFILIGVISELVISLFQDVIPICLPWRRSAFGGDLSTLDQSLFVIGWGRTFNEGYSEDIAELR